MFGLESKSIVGLQLGQIPVAEKLRGVVARNYREVLARGRPKTIRDCHVDMNSYRGSVNVQLTPLSEEHSRNVIIALEPVNKEGTARGRNPGPSNSGRRAVNKGGGKPKKAKRRR
jgi:hypothetical protein